MTEPAYVAKELVVTWPDGTKTIVPCTLGGPVQAELAGLNPVSNVNGYLAHQVWSGTGGTKANGEFLDWVTGASAPVHIHYRVVGDPPVPTSGPAE